MPANKLNVPPMLLIGLMSPASSPRPRTNSLLFTAFQLVQFSISSYWYAQAYNFCPIFPSFLMKEGEKIWYLVVLSYDYST